MPLSSALRATFSVSNKFFHLGYWPLTLNLTALLLSAFGNFIESTPSLQTASTAFSCQNGNLTFLKRLKKYL